MTRLSRRSFLKGAVALGTGVFLYRVGGGFKLVNAEAGPVTRQLRLIHTNDHHARIEPTTGIGIGGGRSRSMGGVARRKTLFDALRAERDWVAAGLDAFDEDFVLVDAGDVFQGTLYFNTFQGQADLWFYNRLGYHAFVPGNHEFNLGDGALADFIRNATFPVLAANITATDPSPLAAIYGGDEVGPTAGEGAGRWGKRTIVELPSGQKVGIFGLSTVETRNISSPSANVSFDPDYAAIANAQAAALRTAGCSTVIALTHISYEADQTLASQTRGINIIVGGHSHTRLLPAVPPNPPVGATSQGLYPTMQDDLDGNKVLIVQDWEWGKWVGDLVIGFDAQGRVSEVGTPLNGVVRPVWANPISTDPLPGEGAEIVPDATFQARITDVYRPAVAALESKVVGAVLSNLPHSSSLVRSEETAIGNLVANAYLFKALQLQGSNPDNYPVVVLLNGGGVRAPLNLGLITVGDILRVAPFGNTLARIDLTGAQLKAALENGVSHFQPGAAVDAARNAVGNGRFPIVANMRYRYTIQRPSAQPPQPAVGENPALAARPGQRVLSAEILIDGKYEPLDPEKTYRVFTNNFLMNGGDGYSVLTTRGDLADPSVGGGTNQVDTFFRDSDILQEYIEAQPGKLIDPKVEGRITRTTFSFVYLPTISTAPAGAAPVVR